VGQGDFTAELVEAGEDLGEDGLDEVFFGGAAWEVGADDLDDKRMQVFEQVPGGVFIAPAHPRDTGFDVQLWCLHDVTCDHISLAG
jgi:hypothetical protein